ncbi:MAG: hypothetical protein KF718_31010 [Polyangiaceae bacterium]|nr:hypothetical protein [Polyangiaceae bacterium]
MERKWTLAWVMVLLAGCGGDDGSEPNTPGPQGKPPQQGAPPNAVGGFAIDVPELTLEPNEEITPCYVFPLELEGPSRFVAAASLTTTAGLHHGNLTSRPKTGEGVRPCEPGDAGLLGGEAGDVLAGGAVLFGSSTQMVGTEWRRFPDGQAFRVKDGYEIVARMHYLNAGSQPLKIAPKYRWYTIPEADVSQEIAPFIWLIRGFEIPPLSKLTVESECWLPQPMKIVDAMPHMHALGERFHVEYLGGARDGQAFLDKQGFTEASDIYSYDPAVDLSQGNGFRFGCTWKNTFNKTIVEGIGDNEMCMLFGYSYPVTSAYNVVATAETCIPAPSPPPDSL